MFFQPTRLAAAGAQMLDTRDPDWFTRINTGRLNIEMLDRCVLGQLNGGDYDEGVAKLDLDEDDEVNYGFWVEHPDDRIRSSRYAGLTGAWKREVKDRCRQMQEA